MMGRESGLREVVADTEELPSARRRFTDGSQSRVTPIGRLPRNHSALPPSGFQPCQFAHGNQFAHLRKPKVARYNSLPMAIVRGAAPVCYATPVGSPNTRREPHFPLAQMITPSLGIAEPILRE
jgi:hypothetical protein